MNTFNGKKITRTTVKSFIRKAGDKLKIVVLARFSGMEDCITSTGQRGFVAAKPAQKANEYNLGIAGAHFVGHGGDYFRAYEKNGLAGIEVNNCCAQFIIAIEA